MQLLNKGCMSVKVITCRQIKHIQTLKQGDIHRMHSTNRGYRNILGRKSCHHTDRFLRICKTEVLQKIMLSTAIWFETAKLTFKIAARDNERLTQHQPNCNTYKVLMLYKVPTQMMPHLWIPDVIPLIEHNTDDQVTGTPRLRIFIVERGRFLSSQYVTNKWLWWKSDQSITIPWEKSNCRTFIGVLMNNSFFLDFLLSCQYTF